MAAKSWWTHAAPSVATRQQLLARAVTVATLGIGAAIAHRDASRVRAEGGPEGASLLTTIGDDPVAPSLRAAATLDLGATPISVPGGWFVPTFGGGSGYAILDEAGGAPMATAVASLGGIATFGPPVSRPVLTADGWIAQIMVRAVVACEPPRASGANASGVIVSAPDLLHQAGLDDLLGASGVPIGAPPPRTPIEAWHRLGWITDHAIRAAYLAPVPAFGAPPAGDEGTAAIATLRWSSQPLPDLATLAGPPTSLVVTTGLWRRQRFERAIVEVPVSGPDGADFAAIPMIVPVGLLLRRATSLPADATAPDSSVGGTVVVRGPLATVGWRVAPAVGVANDAVPLPTPTPRPPDATVRGPALTVTAPGVPGTPPTSVPPMPTAGLGARVPGAAIRVRSVTATGGAERVVLANDGSAPQEIGGWAVRSGASSTAYRLPAGLRLDPGATVTLLSGRDAPSVAPAGSVTLARRSLWRDDGGTILLVDREGDEVDRHAWP